MHLGKGVWRHLIVVLALVAFALPLATTPTSVSAAPAQQTIQTTNPATIGTCDATGEEGCVVSAGAINTRFNSHVDFNVVGSPHTFTFTCGADVAGLTGTGATTPAPVAGCYDVTGSVSNESTGDSVSIIAARCGNETANPNGSTVSCAGTQSPICPVDTGPFSGSPECDSVANRGADTDSETDTVADPSEVENEPRDNQVAIEINPGQPDSYLVTFTGYTLRSPSGGCPAGTTPVAGPFTVHTSVGVTPFEAAVPVAEGVCRFSVQAEKKYVEVTSLKITPLTGPCSVGTPSNSTLLFSEAFKGYFGASCTFTVSAIGKVVLNKGGCTITTSTGSTATEPNGSSASAPNGDFPVGSTYNCTSNGLEVDNIPIASFAQIPISVNVVSGGGSAAVSNFPPGPTLTTNAGVLCAGTSGAGLAAGQSIGSITGSTIYLCPTGPGSGQVQACAVGLVDTQPGNICSNFLNFSFILPNGQRVVPYVRWAGEKQVLTKCFGGSGLLAGAPVEFTLEGGGVSAQAALIPASFGNGFPTVGGATDNFGTGNQNPGNGGTGTGTNTVGGGTAFQSSQDTVWTVTDQDGCATVIVFAAGEGQVVVDASLFSQGPSDVGTTPIINEHAFEIFYLKFDHLDLENVALNSVSGTTITGGSTAPPINSLGFTSTPPGFLGASSTAGAGTFGAIPSTFTLPSPPGTNLSSPGAPAGTYNVPLCDIDYVRAMVHGYFELPGDPSGRPATSVTIGGTASIGGQTPNNPVVGSYVLPAGRWILPEDWPVLATFAGFAGSGLPFDVTPASSLAWDLNSGWVFNPGNERALLCNGPSPVPGSNTSSGIPPASTSGVQGPETQINGPAGAANGTLLAGGAIPNSFTGAFVSYGPCYSQDAGGVPYQSAGPVVPNVTSVPQAPCVGGVTVGIGPFDITQACTSPPNLTYTPAGSNIVTSVTPGGLITPTNFTYGPVSENSTYLPNGTLNEWDAPMPAAQISFGVVGSGAGYFNQVNKTGFYAIPTTVTCATGVTPPCYGAPIYPDPFYAEAIPASPLIPPVSNNGGYFWDTYGFHAGGTVGPTTTPGFVAGESTVAPTLAVTNGGCPPGFIPLDQSSGPGTGTTPSCYVGAGGAANATITQNECSALGGTFTVVTPAGAPGGVAQGTCFVEPFIAGANTPGGLNLTNFGDCPANVGGVFGAIPFGGTGGPAPGTRDSVDVADGRGFVAGMTVEVYSSVNGHTITTALVLTDVTPIPGTYAGAPNAATLTFDDNTIPVGLCVLAYHGAFVSEQTQITLPLADQFNSNANLNSQTVVTLATPTNAQAPNGATASTTLAEDAVVGGLLTITAFNASCFNPGGVPAGSGCVYLQGSEALARELGNCVMSRSPNLSSLTYQPGTCEPGTYLPLGTIVSLGPTTSSTTPVGSVTTASDTSSADLTGGQGPYPFWQFVPNAAPAGSAAGGPRSATVYSDNHGEAVVSLETGIISVLSPTNGVCPTGYLPAPSAAAPATCLLDYSTLGTTANSGGVAFPNVAAAQAAVGTSGSLTPGCVTTTSAGVGTPATTTAPVVGPNGPTGSQICVNKLGGIEFGPNAILGSTTIQAIADYPYFKGLHPAISSQQINKVFTSAFAKTVTVAPTGTPCSIGSTGCGIAGPVGTTEFNVTVSATDICGRALANEPVDIYAFGNAGAVVIAPIGANVSPLSTSSAYAVLDANGKATVNVEVLNAALGNAGVTIKVVFPLERIERFATLVPGTTVNQTVTVLYNAGYNQIGGPPGSNFSSAEAVYAFNPSTNTYTAATASAGNLSSAAPTCTGYFAYFAAITAVNLPVPTGAAAGQTAACTLSAGYNLVGNPFPSPARLPANVTAYHFNGTGYDVVGLIPTGGSVWIFNDGTLNTVTLTST